jgi:hypothetical protein
MPDDTEMDQELRRLARTSLDRRAGDVDVDTEFAALSGRLSEQLPATPHGARRDPTRWLAAAAAVVLVVAGVVAISLLRDRRDTSLVVPPADTSATSTTPASSVPASTDAPQTTPAPTTTNAVATTLAPATTSPSISETSLPSATTAALDVGYFGRRYVNDAPYFAIDEFDADGTVLRTLSNDELAGLFPRYELPDGQTLTLEGSRPESRCVNQKLTPAPHPALAAARSIGVTAQGVVVAGRDVCPGGGRWGDPGTHWELVALDLTASPPSNSPPSVDVLQTLSAEPAQILFQSDDVVVAAGEPIIDSISDDGRYIALRESYTSEQTRWHVVDLEAPTEMLDVDSTCELAGDIVAPPRFVGNGIVVVARLCVPPDAAEPANGQLGRGAGDVQVEAVDLTATAPSERIVWHSSVPGLGADGYSRTAGLSARLGDDGAVWAILTAGGDVERQGRTFVLHGDAATEITQDGYYDVAFDPGQLIMAWDEPA